MSIKKQETIIDQTNNVIRRWPEYAARTGVTTDLINGINQTLNVV